MGIIFAWDGASDTLSLISHPKDCLQMLPLRNPGQLHLNWSESGSIVTFQMACLQAAKSSKSAHEADWFFSSTSLMAVANSLSKVEDAT